MPIYLGPPITTVLTHFDPSQDALIEEMPQHMAGAADPSAELYKWIGVEADAIDALSTAVEVIVKDSHLATATADGLVSEWAVVYGLGAEVANLGPEQLRDYIQEWVTCDGTTKAIERLLLAIINLNPANNGGTVLTFPGGGGGLTFPTSGGLTLYQYATKPDQTVGFTFPSDGSGITFPDQALYFPNDGTGLTLPATLPNVADLTFPNNAWVILTEAFSSYALTVTVKSYLAFDRGAFKRAIARFAQAHTTTSYVESNT